MSEQYPQQQPGSMLDIRPSFLFFAFLLYFFKPYYSINGSAPVQGQWKQNPVPVPPGRYQVTVWVNYLFKPQMGMSSIVVDVPPGAAAAVTWRAPLTIFGSGRMAVAGVGPMNGGPNQQPQQSQYPQQQQPAQQQSFQQESFQQPAFQQQPERQPQHQAQEPQHQAASPAAAPGGWHPDPTGRHQVRYYDGSAWTEHVGDNGAQSRDPIS